MGRGQDGGKHRRHERRVTDRPARLVDALGRAPGIIVNRPLKREHPRAARPIAERLHAGLQRRVVVPASQLDHAPDHVSRTGGIVQLDRTIRLRHRLVEGFLRRLAETEGCLEVETEGVEDVGQG